MISRQQYDEAEALLDARRQVRNVTNWGEIEATVAEGVLIRKWLRAESGCYRQVRAWLDAEGRHKALEARRNLYLSSEAYAAGECGWEMVRRFMPTLDGPHVESFWDLPEALQFRYAAFAAAVLEIDVPVEVRSDKQKRKLAEVES